MSETRKPWLRLGILGGLISCLWVLPTAPSESKVNGQDGKIAIEIVQIGTGTHLMIEIQCDPVILKTPNELDGFACVLRNNTDKNIAATNLTYTVTLDRKGVGLFEDLHTLTSVMLIHPDFRNSYKPIAPGAERRMNGGTVSYGDALIQSLKVSVDYIEFEDGTTLGPNVSGARVLAEMREGAATYRTWLAGLYLKKEKPLSELILLLESSEPLPSELDSIKFSNSNQEAGAKAYRSYLRRKIASSGPAEFGTYLRK